MPTLLQIINFMEHKMGMHRSEICYLFQIHYSMVTMIRNKQVKSIKLNAFQKAIETLRKNGQNERAEELLNYVFNDENSQN